MKIPHSPEGKWPVIKNPKLKGLHITTCGLCNKGNSNWYFRTAFSCSDYQTILFFFLFFLTMMHLHSSFYRIWNNKEVCSEFVYHPLIRVTQYETENSLFSGKVYSHVLEFGFVLFFGVLALSCIWVLDYWNFSIVFSSYFSISSISFGGFQCSVQTLLLSPAQQNNWLKNSLLAHQPQGRREQFTGIFQISPVKKCPAGCPILTGCFLEAIFPYFCLFSCLFSSLCQKVFR